LNHFSQVSVAIYAELEFGLRQILLTQEIPQDLLAHLTQFTGIARVNHGASQFLERTVILSIDVSLADRNPFSLGVVLDHFESHKLLQHCETTALEQ